MPPMPSSAASIDATGLHPDPLIDAAQALAEMQAFGTIWLSPDLQVVGFAGLVPDGTTTGVPVTDLLVALIGLEDDLQLLRTELAPEPLRLPNTAVISQQGHTSRRLNIFVFWVANRQRFLVLLGAIIMQGSPEAELDQEIRRRRLIEQDLAAKSLEYARINQQLEQFAYVISHDLNAPLRALRYLTGDIQLALDGAASDGHAIDTSAVRDAAAQIATQTRRMSKMLVDLLDYARIGRVQDAVELVATRALIGEIVATLNSTTTVAIVVSGSWPTLRTVAAPLDLVLRNLVENAVKHHDRADGRIEINGEEGEQALVFRIIDDGRGIAPEWQSAIFEPFRKIDDAHHPESSGIGLALVKKTVTTLGGTIEVHSQAPAQRGTTFTVRWPRKLAIADDSGR